MTKPKDGKVKKESIPNFLWTVQCGHWPDVYVVKWDDPCSNIHETWFTPEQVKTIEPMVCMASGFLIEKTPKFVKIAGTVAAHGHMGNIIAIPLSNITHIGRVAGV